MSDVREIKKLSEVCDFQNGFAFKSNKFKSDGLPILRISNIQNNHISTKDLVFFDVNDYKEDFERYKVLKNDIIIAMSGGTTGKIGINQTDNIYYLNQRVGKFSPKKNLDRQYLFYFLHTKSEESLKIAGGAAQPNLSTEQIKNFQIPVPSITKQRTIVAKLDQAFAAIDQAKANIEKNIANAKELFQSKLNQIFSEKGEGFIEEKLDNVLIKTKNINPKDFPGKTFRYVDVSAVDRNKLEITEFSEINSDNAPSRARKLILENDVIFATVRPTLRRVALIDKNFDSQICSTGYVVLRNNNNKLLPKMIYYYLLTSYFLENIEKLQKGASYPAVTDGEVKSQLINYPKSLETQQQIVTQLDQLQEQTNVLVTKYQQKLANLEELKKSILEKAFKGELSTAAIEKV